MTRRNGPAERAGSPPRGALPAAATDDAQPAGDSGTIHWGSLHNDWQDAASAGQERPVQRKEPLPYGVLLAIALHRVDAVSFMRDTLDHDPSLRKRIGSLQRHAPDAQGRTWDIATLDQGCSQLTVFERELRRIMDAMRDQFDLV